MNQPPFSHLLPLRALIFYIALAAAMLSIIPSATAAPENSKNIQQVAQSKVRDCYFVADVQGFSGWGKIAMKAWKDKAKHQALQQASDLGATHVVWTHVPKAYSSDPYTYGEAYKCGSAEKLAHQKSSSPQGSE